MHIFSSRLSNCPYTYVLNAWAFYEGMGYRSAVHNADNGQLGSCTILILHNKNIVITMYIYLVHELFISSHALL